MEQNQKGFRKKAPRQKHHKSIQSSPGRKDTPVKVALPFSKKGPETQQDALKHRNICYYRASQFLWWNTSSFYKWRKVYWSKDLSVTSVKRSSKGAVSKSVLLFPLLVLMEVSPRRLMSIVNCIPQYFVISGKLYLPKKTILNFGLGDNANIYQCVLIVVITPKF